MPLIETETQTVGTEGCWLLPFCRAPLGPMQASACPQYMFLFASCDPVVNRTCDHEVTNDSCILSHLTQPCGMPPRAPVPPLPTDFQLAHCAPTWKTQRCQRRPRERSVVCNNFHRT
ncbi:hypothetical protein NDU88_004305 [Pleurodeles waltl]|uniref:Uncharacterized protein n=1 Tax=Pleurodeles waltl TaxID=8319 RepID=A0AAV7QC72_PLEWA|nr:hypothetical protein NDU88_004305 [Pleurodeles waltl]